MAGGSSSGEGGFARESAWGWNDAYRRERGALVAEQRATRAGPIDQWPHSPMANLNYSASDTGSDCDDYDEDAESLRAQLESLDLPLSFGSSRGTGAEGNGVAGNRKLSPTRASSPPSEDGWSSDCSEDSRAVRDLWFAGFDEEWGVPYFYCDRTGESKWSPPEDELDFVFPLFDLDAAPGGRALAEKLVGRLLPQTRNHNKYWQKRHSLFSKFERGVRMDATAWFSVTPEKLAEHHAETIAGLLSKGGLGRGVGASESSGGAGLVVLDAFAGVGGNAIQLARRAEITRVLACEISPELCSMGRSNAQLYGVQCKLDFLCCDCFDLALGRRESGDWPPLRSAVDAVFLSPPWGGPSSFAAGGAQWIRHFPGLPVSTAELVRRALGVARACVLYLPKQSYSLVGEIMKEAGVGAEDFLVEKNYVYVSFEDKPRQKHFVAITVYAFR
mmetsp:Transcript_6454/g.22211  ORF Transcript_6454/g.22211 Transcript_6454/m.22211 type:complete len:445 (-) Transcript_6454:141-1475(-)|eukprot:CAMPEP_0197513212 /NCGR_PEP_ID=MMETSP1312-20131121/80311_1 /TAXON_ID=464262 /ORGANISM="Genus nov. species nov., Strain RCC2335" /LENGTH=444 /DNA_ID=CAMNT_0043061339 /DNA_START=73 /DNA_END=1407 /DNA_ORIENTATION=-